MLMMNPNGIFIPIDEINESDNYICPWCGQSECKCRTNTKYNGVILDRKHFVNIENIERLFMISGYSFTKFNRINTYYIDLLSNTNNNMYKCTLKLIDKDIPYKSIATEVFALSMAKNYVTYIINGDNLLDDIETLNIYKFIMKYYGHLTILYNNKLYNLYRDGNKIEIKIPKLYFDLSRCVNGTYYKIGKIKDRKIK